MSDDIIPEVHLGQGLQELRPDQPIGAVPQGQQVDEQLQAQLTQSAAADGHEAVLQEHTGDRAA